MCKVKVGKYPFDGIQNTDQRETEHASVARHLARRYCMIRMRCQTGIVDGTDGLDSGPRKLGCTHLTSCYQASESNRVEASIFIKVHASLPVVARRADSLRWWYRVERQVVATHVTIVSLSVLSYVGCYFAKRREPDIAI